MPTWQEALRMRGVVGKGCHGGASSCGEGKSRRPGRWLPNFTMDITA